MHLIYYKILINILVFYINSGCSKHEGVMNFRTNALFVLGRALVCFVISGTTMRFVSG